MTNMEYRELRDLRKAREQGNDLIGFMLCLQALSMALLVAIFILILIQNAKAEEIEIRPASKPVLLTAAITIADEEVPTETEETLCEDVSEAPELIYLGVYTTTGYCNCKRCCGKWAGGPTASGVMPREQHTVAVDPAVIPLGTRLLVDGIEYVAEDTGSGVNGKHLDVYYGDHQTAWRHGVQKKEVWMIKEEEK